tara:strand:+ start:1433 stop:1849 length:417 start_codon:yes stop_codon:yes gene_type:complete
MYIFDEDYLQIEIKDNKLIYYSELDIIPTETQFKEAEEALLNYFAAIEKKKITFYQIFNIDNASISSIYNYSTVISWICNFFHTQHNIFEKYLRCTVIIIDNLFMKNSINLVLKAYQPARPIYFIVDLDELDDLLKLH